MDHLRYKKYVSNSLFKILHTDTKNIGSVVCNDTSCVAIIRLKDLNDTSMNYKIISSYHSKHKFS